MGGLRREWINLLCDQLFGPRCGLFGPRCGLFGPRCGLRAAGDDQHGPVHPSFPIPAGYTVDHYRFAGNLAAKCLYESSPGPGYRQLVTARFTRSFLAQLVGSRVNYKHFESDDPQLYASKIKYIEHNDVTDLGLTFSQEEYDAEGRLIGTLDFIRGGSRIIVTNDNKLAYLNALAKYRLVDRVKEQVGAFLSGFRQLVPEHLLSILDEDELDMLMCGTSDYTADDFWANHVVVDRTPELEKVLGWLRTAMSNFSDQERSGFLQFVTGSPRLPVGGLGHLVPKLQIGGAPTFAKLPRAHTCYHFLCLSDYAGYGQFEKLLLIAINEVSEGFEFA